MEEKYILEQENEVNLTSQFYALFSFICTSYKSRKVNAIS